MAVFSSRVFNNHAVVIYEPKTIIAYQKTNPIKYENTNLSTPKKQPTKKDIELILTQGLLAIFYGICILPVQVLLLFEIHMII